MLTECVFDFFYSPYNFRVRQKVALLISSKRATVVTMPLLSSNNWRIAAVSSSADDGTVGRIFYSNTNPESITVTVQRSADSNQHHT
jgi:hypothetical protein